MYKVVWGAVSYGAKLLINIVGQFFELCGAMLLYTLVLGICFLVWGTISGKLVLPAGEFAEHLSSLLLSTRTVACSILEDRERNERVGETKGQT